MKILCRDLENYMPLNPQGWYGGETGGFNGWDPKFGGASNKKKMVMIKGKNCYIVLPCLDCPFGTLVLGGGGAYLPTIELWLSEDVFLIFF